ncbi:hypothetical protein AB0L65_54980 [Nonomuraea sp. NPDC052116]|uniref:hypothetical protein n=1 Tax=Nonomuraea sp. NPDC052116 TaxID=3155665 RepID=UPI003435963E
MNLTPYRWWTREVLAQHGMYRVNDLIPHLAERGIALPAFLASGATPIRRTTRQRAPLASSSAW